MKVILLLFVAICCAAAVQANSSQIKSTNSKTDQKGNGTDAECTEDQKERERLEKEQKDKERQEKKEKEEKERKDKEQKEKERKEKERKEKERKAKEQKEKERKEKECKDNKNEQKDNKHNGKDDKIWWDCKHPNDHKKPCDDKPSKPACNTICSMIADPICAAPDGIDGDSRTFENECQLNVYNCQNPKAKYIKSYDGACEPEAPNCPQFCPYYVKPFCALADGWCSQPQTFGNPCFLAIYNCENPTKKYKYFHDGECITTTTAAPDCGLIDCSQDVLPFCGLPKDSCGKPQTFNNKCYLEVYNCFNPDQQYEYFHDGACLTATTPEPECIESVCPNDDKKVCGLPDGFCGKLKSFPNECYMKIYNAFNPKEQYKYFHDGACLDEPTTSCDSIICTKEYFPFCGTPEGNDGEIRTFGNICEFDEYNCKNPGSKFKYFYDGECIAATTSAPDCGLIDCPQDVLPFCGLPKDSCGEPQTFNNKCYLEVYNCFNPDQQYEFFHDGECLTTPAPESECPTICPLYFDPVCAKGLSGNVRTFSNDCDFASYNCQNQNNLFTFAYKGECNECSDILCNKIGQPVCAENSEKKLQTFGNPCQLQQYNCDYCNDKYEYSYDGSCIEPVICTEEYIPVCAISPKLGSRTFSNKCERDVYISQNPADGFVPAYDGECKKVCQSGCPKILAPVCGVDCNGKEKTFDNMCLYELYNCLNPNDQYTLAYESRCNNCNILCTLEMNPICSENSADIEKTFSNQCDFEKYNCMHPNDIVTKKYDGQCNNCQVACTREWAPKCATDGVGNEKQFSNQCELESYNCRYPDDQCSLAYDGECHECSTMCTQIVQPVCTKDSLGNNKTWPNQCELNSYNCRYPYNLYVVEYEGECKKTSCVKPCPRIIDEICAKDQKGNTKTFNTECEMNNYNCDHSDSKYTKSSKGRCKPVCQDICPAIYKPVCASSNGDGYCTDAQTFSNQCSLDSYNCHNPTKVLIKASNGECPKN